MLRFSQTSGDLLLWSLWAISLIVLAVLTKRGLDSAFRKSGREIAFREEGHGYVLSFVMVVPLYILTMCVVVETSLVLMSKFGAVYSSYYAARAAIVSYPTSDIEVARERVERAAHFAFLPFANGVHAKDRAGQTSTDAELNAYIDTLRDFSGRGSARGENYIRAKSAYLENALRVEVNVDGQGKLPSWRDDLAAKVTYQHAYHMPIIGRIIGHYDASIGAYCMKISSETKLQSEAPQNEEQSLGISYASK